MLEVEMLLQAEAQAAENPSMAAATLNDLREGLRAELPEEPEDDATPSEEDAETPAPEVATEALQRVHVTRLATEDVGEFLGSAGRRAGAMIGGAVMYLGHLGITYGPTILRKAYKGVVFAVSRIAKVTYLGALSLSRYIERRGMEVDKLQAEIDGYRKSIQLLRDTGREIGTGPFTDDTLISALSTDGELKWLESLDVSRHVLSNLMIESSKSVLAEISGLRRQMQEYNPKTYSPDTNTLTVRPPKGMSRRTSVRIGDTEFESYQYPEALPGDRVVTWRMPVSETETTDVQRITFAVNVVESKPVSQRPEYMSLDDLAKYLDKLEGLCSLMREQQKLYTLVKERRAALRGGLKLYLNRILMVDTPVHIGSSMLDVVYMRSTLIDRVYLLGMMDLQDAISRVMRDSLYVVKRHVRNHTAVSETE